MGVFRGHPLAIPLGYPTPPRGKVSLRSPLSDGDNTSSGTGVPIQEATTANRWLSRALIDRSPYCQRSGFLQGITTGSLASRCHQYSSEYGAGTCPTKGRQGVRLLPPFPFGGDRRFLEPQAEKIDVRRGHGLIKHGSAYPGGNHRRSIVIVGLD